MQPYTDSGNTRTIGITGCQLTPGKFRVTTFRADSRFSQDGYREADLDTTSVDSYFYMGAPHLVLQSDGCRTNIGALGWQAPGPNLGWNAVADAVLRDSFLA